jgi:DNA uptake protein ComE-like DNA-binding protein
MPAYTVGIFAFVPLLHAAIKLKRQDLWRFVIAYGIGTVILLVLSSPDDAGEGISSALTTVLAIAMAVVGTIQAHGLVGDVFAEEVSTARQISVEQDPAVLNARHARERRKESAELAARDPAIAVDLRIGRPDLPRQYDDGGLVDINHVPEDVFRAHLGMSAEQARSVVEARDQVGRFESADDMGNLAVLPPRVVDGVRDRLIAL